MRIFEIEDENLITIILSDIRTEFQEDFNRIVKQSTPLIKLKNKGIDDNYLRTKRKTLRTEIITVIEEADKLIDRGGWTIDHDLEVKIS